MWEEWGDPVAEDGLLFPFFSLWKIEKEGLYPLTQVYTICKLLCIFWLQSFMIMTMPIVEQCWIEIELVVVLVADGMYKYNQK